MAKRKDDERRSMGEAPVVDRALATIKAPGLEASRRDRTWEQEQRAAGRVVTYRGVPTEVQEQIRNMAAEIGVPVGEVARLALERLIDDYEHGRVKPEAHVVHARRSLFDAGGRKR